MFLIGRNRYAREGYPESNPGNAAFVALTNRYLTAQPPATPDPFTQGLAGVHALAAVNVTRKASGLFMVAVQFSAVLAAPDTMQFAASASFGGVASGGTASGNWLIATGPALVVTPLTQDSLSGQYDDERDAGNLQAGVTLVGVGAVPIPAGNSAIVILGQTTAGTTLVTPGILIASAYELP
ncbi:MAG: hypothetical protein ACRDOK_18810 [Streptosporangiaceae bacterium]